MTIWNITRKRSMPAGLLELLIVVTAAAVIPIAMVYFGGSSRDDVPDPDNSLQKVLEAGQLVLGFDEGFPPMSFLNDDGEYVGFDIDIIQEVCKRLGVALVKHPIKWDAKENELYNRTIDCISSMSVTQAMKKIMSLSEPYIKDDLVFVVPGSSSVKWLRDLKGKTIGVQYGSTTQRALNVTNIRKEVMAVLLDDNMSILLQLKDDKLDAGLVDSLAAYYFIYSSNEEYFILDDSLGEEKFVMGFRKNDRKLRDRVQEIISGMKSDGILGKISQKWFGSDITIVR